MRWPDRGRRINFTVGIHDDVTNTSLEYDRSFQIEHDEVTRAIFFGLGSDGTVGGQQEQHQDHW